MFVYALNNSFVRLYSLGKEVNYFGKYIEYDDTKNTFLFFYYSYLTRLYVINGINEEDTIVQVKPRVNKILCCDNKAAKRFISFINEKKSDDFIFSIPPMFFREAYSFIENKNYKLKLNELYLKYKKDIDNGISYPLY